ncbi:hypothetical protein L798_11944 [Zootermopsis nevadensis]|uniref:Uncharacterized protein n=1 Tax=Zootermopsis nevadensis TaxID=136037 RepID=A0A067QUX4_ZOONE|nr:hypothetical protein L798_11944 [Zootermopsis nevadensis]
MGTEHHLDLCQRDTVNPGQEGRVFQVQKGRVFQVQKGRVFQVQ